MKESQRLVSLDILRGLTIAGMIIVNCPGSWAYVYPPLRHAPWHGITPTDFVFPFFVFIVGISIVLAYTKRRDQGVNTGRVMRKVWVRAAMIFGVGIFLATPMQAYEFRVAKVLVGIILIYGLSEVQVPAHQGGTTKKRAWLWGMIVVSLGLLLGLQSEFSPSSIRIPGVLQRIALVFLFCALLFWKTNWRTQAIVGTFFLVGYWLALVLIPVPIDAVIRDALASGEVMRSSGAVPVEGLRALSEHWAAPNLEPGVNLQAWVDRMVVPGRIWERTWDPEGVLSTMPAIGSGIAGMMAGHLVLRTVDKAAKVNSLFVYGFCLLFIGSIWEWFFPFNKNLWTSSFVLYTAGLGSLTFAALYWYVDLNEKGRSNPLFFMGRVFGANAITAYVLHSLFAGIYSPARDGAMDVMLGMGIQGEFASLVWAVVYTLFIYAIVLVMYNRKLFLRL